MWKHYINDKNTSKSIMKKIIIITSKLQQKSTQSRYKIYYEQITAKFMFYAEKFKMREITISSTEDLVHFLICAKETI